MSNSTSSTATKVPSDTCSPTITPLHDPKNQAKIIPQAKPLGVSNSNIVPGMTTTAATAGLGQKALLAKKFAKANKSTISPTDQIQSPCTAKLTNAKQRHFTKAKPASLSKSFVAIRGNEGAAPTPPSSASRPADF